MEILTLYVGQGSFVVARHLQRAIAVDTRLPNELEEETKSKVKNFLSSYELDGIVLTGFDADHADPEGLDWLLDYFTPSWVMYPKYYQETQNASQVFNVITKHEKRREGTPNPLQRVSVRLDDLDSRFFHHLSQAFRLELFSPHTEDMESSNNCSIVLKIEGVGSSAYAYLVTGDTENSRWDTIVSLFGNALDADVLAAPHHGSKNAAHLGMALAVRPDTVLISAGVDNQYGHPDAEACRLYLKVANQVFATCSGSGNSLLTRLVGEEFKTQIVA